MPFISNHRLNEMLRNATDAGKSEGRHEGLARARALEDAKAKVATKPASTPCERAKARDQYAHNEAIAQRAYWNSTLLRLNSYPVQTAIIEAMMVARQEERDDPCKKHCASDPGAAGSSYGYPRTLSRPATHIAVATKADTANTIARDTYASARREILALVIDALQLDDYIEKVGSTIATNGDGGTIRNFATVRLEADLRTALKVRKARAVEAHENATEARIAAIATIATPARKPSPKPAAASKKAAA